ncbi:hypothetical protein [Schlesneria sp. DSM 10557]|uniref:hypothetical protein n=1 Tax=Schlesneria sp. DSM 10557 TaxID=3044399 RepID=UPI0035A0646F
MAVDTEIAREQDELLAQMEESRESLAHKIELLEGKVAETVETATATVQEATANVLETVQTATATVSETVGTVTDAVQGTVQDVRTTLYDGVESVKGAFDISQHVEKHPWISMMGAVAVGYVGASLLHRPSAEPRTRSKSYGHSGIQGLSSRPYEEFAPSPTNTVPPTVAQYAANDSTLRPLSSAPQSSAPPSKSWISMLSETLGPEINKLKGLAIGTALGAVRDSVLQSAPEAMKKPLADVIDEVTQKLGGECLQGSLFTSDSTSSGGSQSRGVPSVPR